MKSDWSTPLPPSRITGDAPVGGVAGDMNMVRAALTEVRGNVPTQVPLSILDYGGVANGSTPNDAAWAAMRADMLSTGRKGWFPGNGSGTAYAFTNPMDVLGHGLHVFGDGSQRTVIRGLDPTKPVIRFGGERSSLRGLTVMHNENPTSTTGDGIQLFKPFLCELSDLVMYRVGWGMTVPAVDADTIFAGVGGGNYAFSCTFDTLRMFRFWQGALRLAAYNAASTGSVVRNVYTNNEDGSASSTTLSSGITAGATTCSLAAAPVPGQVIYIDTAGTVECRAVTAVTGAGPYTVTVNDGFLSNHSSGAAVLLSNKYRAHQNVVNVTACDEMAMHQINIEGVMCDGNVIQFQDADVAVVALHFERVNCQGWEGALTRIYGDKTHVDVRAMVVAFCDFRNQTSDVERAVFSLAEGGTVNASGLAFKGNKVENGINMRLVRITSNNAIGAAYLNHVELGPNTATDATYSPAGTNLRSGLQFNTGYTAGDSAALPRVCQINDRRYRWQSATGREHVWGTAAPATGTWAVGDTVWNSTPAAGGTTGWVCTTAGSPGTWKAMPNLAA